MTMHLEPLGDGGLAGLAAALSAEKLPTDDLLLPNRRFFRLLHGEAVVGYAGLEGAGDDLLLRSIVVASGLRGHGHGADAVALLEGEARQSGAKRLHLLTTGAAMFFERLGYRPAERSAAPGGIASTQQFASLCPASAAYLVKAL